MLAFIYAATMGLFTLSVFSLGVRSVPEEITASFSVALFFTLSTIVSFFVTVYLYNPKLSWLSGKVFAAIGVANIVALYALYGDPIPNNSHDMSSLFNIPINGELTEENIEQWSEKFADKELKLYAQSDGRAIIELMPKSLIDKNDLTAIDTAQIITLIVKTNADNIINEIRWLKTENKADPEWETVVNNFKFDAWLNGFETKRYWDGKYVLEKGEGATLLRLYDARSLSSNEAGLNERLGRAKLHSIFGE